jgi:uncharacterized repeat protein (TIGR03843 family)
VPQDQRPARPSTLTLLATGPLELEGRMPWASNGTYLVTVASPTGETLRAIYKPGSRERPLWDFPDGLWRREVAAYELDRALGWGLVPETVVRHDGPLGAGSLQRFVEADFEQHYFTLLESGSYERDLKRMAAFDVIANNADRKGGHCLLDAEGHVWGVDHGLCFHEQPKLRTVIWDFAGEAISDYDLDSIRRLLACGLPPSLDSLLRPVERRALLARAGELVRTRRLPQIDSAGAGYRPYPWPVG